MSWQGLEQGRARGKGWVWAGIRACGTALFRLSVRSSELRLSEEGWEPRSLEPGFVGSAAGIWKLPGQAWWEQDQFTCSA